MTNLGIQRLQDGFSNADWTIQRNSDTDSFNNGREGATMSICADFVPKNNGFEIMGVKDNGGSK